MLKRSDELPTSPAQAEPRQSSAAASPLPPSTAPKSKTDLSKGSGSAAPPNTSEQGSKAQSPGTQRRPNPLRLLSRQSRSTSATSDGHTLRYRVTDIIKPVDRYPPGYGRVAAFEDCDPSFSLYRKFGWLHNRVLLHLQDELQELEEELESLDDWEFSSGDCKRLKSRRIDYGRPNAPRKALLIQIGAKLAEYDEALLRLQRKQDIRRATKRNQNSLYNAIKEHGNIASGEALWVHHRDDLLAIAKDAEHGWFNGVLEDTLRMLSSKITLAIFRTPEKKIQTGSISSMSLISAHRLDILLRIVLTVIAVALLLIPVLILYEIQPTTASDIKSSSRAQIATIFSFTIAFSASCSIFTKARRQEVFTATAAYCAVLVVFLGNTSNVIVLPK